MVKQVLNKRISPRTKWAAFWVGLVALTAQGCTAIKPPSAHVPSVYALYTAPDKGFACVGPDKWKKAEAGGGGMMSAVTFTDQMASVDILSDLQGSLIGDIAKSSNTSMESLAGSLPPGMNLPPLPKPVPPVEMLHKSGKSKVAQKVTRYAESTMREFPCPYGDARVSEWTGDAGMMGGGKVRGLRATVLGNERRVTVVCQCPEREWPQMKPVFSRILRSLKNG